MLAIHEKKKKMLIISGLKTITDKYRAKFYNQNSDKKKSGTAI